jgi:site-specific DNA recombinase
MGSTPSRAAIYVRISKDAEKLGLGVERQEDGCRQLADRQGWGVAAVLSDNDISAWSGKHRPAYEQLLAGLADGTFDGLVIWNGDRLTRRVGDLLELIKLIDGHNIPVAAVAAGLIDLTTAGGVMNAIQLANYAQYESAIKSERIRAQKRQLATSGGYNGGMRPLGFEKDGVTHHATEAAMLRKAAEDILDGRSINSISKETGVARRTLHRALLGPRIAGLRSFHGEVVGEAEWEPILDRATWEQLRVVITDPRRKVTKPARSYLLTGMVWAVDEDGQLLDKMLGRPDNGTRRYLAEKPKQRSIAADPLEAHVIDMILRRFDTVQPMAPQPVDDAATSAAAEVVQLEQEMSELADLRGQGAITVAEWMAARGPLQERLEAARAAIPTRRTPTAAQSFWTTPGALRSAWAGADTFQRQREILQAVVERVEVGPARTRGSVFDTSRIRIVPRRV